MVDNIKTGIGFFIPVASLIGFVLSILSNNYFVSIIFIVSGMMIWMLYILVVESNTPALMGNILILFVVLLSLAVFLNYGLSQNMFGGYELKSDGSLIALLVLFFGGLIGMIFRQSISDSSAPSLSSEDLALVNKALEKSDNLNDAKVDPKVIVVKQEVPKEVVKEEPEEEEEEEWDYSQMYAYPPEYYEEYEEEEEDEYEE
tara:strand:+ start:451 stop:1056 length:606 start_codon:yes stop_codon:yes gene_type:complete